MALYQAVVTDVGREKLPKYWGDILPLSLITYFKVGEGGWVDPGSGREPREPDPSLTDLDIIVDFARLPANQRYNDGNDYSYFQKALVGGDFSFVAPTILRVSCMLLNAEYNTQSPGGILVYDVGGPYTNPDIWEIGMFDLADDMIFYGTFVKQTKDPGKQIENICRVTF